MRLGRAPDLRKAFAERRMSFLHVVAIIGLVTACWYVWSRTQRSSSASTVASTPLPPIAQQETQSNQVADDENSPTPLMVPTNIPVPALAKVTNQIESVSRVATNRIIVPQTNIAGASYLAVTNADGSVNPPGWIAETQPEAMYRSHAATSVLEAQVGMANRGISPGPIDGLMGSQTRLALRAFQEQLGIPATGELDAYTRRALWVRRNPISSYVISSNDLSRLMPMPDTWLAKSQVKRLDYQSILEVVAERGWAYERFIRSLNPQVNWDTVRAGTRVDLPNVQLPTFTSKAAYAKIHLSGRNLQAYDSTDRIMIHFPCSIARRVDKRPLGELHVAVLVRNPNYTFNPEIFTESEEGRILGRKLTVPPGPNNPVGVAWVGLDRPGYGIHGTPEPELVGRTESHGCFRLANWNAQILADISWVGMPVFVEP